MLKVDLAMIGKVLRKFGDVTGIKKALVNSGLRERIGTVMSALEQSFRQGSTVHIRFGRGRKRSCGGAGASRITPGDVGAKRE
jgi:hypothetical protein